MQKVPTHLSSSEEGSINLSRDTNLLSSLETMERDKMVWRSGSDTKSYEDLEERIIRILNEKYVSVYKGGFLPFYLSFMFRGETLEGYSFKERGRRLDSPECVRVLKQFLKSVGDLVVMRISVRRKKDATRRRISHECVLIFDKKRFKVELHDPNGYHELLSEYPFIIDAVAGFISALNLSYKLVDIQDNNLKYGFQSMEYSISQKHYSDYIDRGLCMIWSLYIVDLRTKFREDDSIEFKKRVQSRVNYLKKRRHPGFFFVNYILEYMLNAINISDQAT